MRILYYPIVDYDKVKNVHGFDHRGDYVVDCLFHGFRKTFGEDCVDIDKNPLMYKTSKIDLNQFTHKGFSMFGLLDDITVDRDDSINKLKSNYFDFVICPIHHTNRNNEDVVSFWVDNLSNFFKPNQIAVVCSDENPGSNAFLTKLLNKCIIFKQEHCLPEHEHFYPISYSVPREKFVDDIPHKELDFAPLMPSFLNRGHSHASTYIYTDEETYYADYGRSYFGFTCKKGGWDCMRHYEIIAAGCVPYFTDLELCPKHTLLEYPKLLALIAKTMKGIYPNWTGDNHVGTAMDLLHTRGHRIDHAKFDEDLYYYLAYQFLSYGKEHLTTEARAKYIINVLLGQL